MSRLAPKDWLWITAVLLMAAGLRIPGLSYGQPVPQYSRSDAARGLLQLETPMHPDEFLFVQIPLQMLLTRDLDPMFFHNPSFLINLNFVTFWLADAGHGLSHADRQGLDTAGRRYAPFHLYLTGRGYSMLGGMLAVAGAIALARRLRRGWLSPMAAGLLAACALPLVQHAHYTTTTSLAAGLSMCAIWASFAALNHRRWPMLIVLAGVCTGLASGNRYNALAVVIVLGLCGLNLIWRERSRYAVGIVALSLLAVPVVFVITSPYAVIEFSFFVEQFRQISAQYLAGEGIDFTTPYGLLFEYRYLILFGMGVSAAILATVGVFTSRRAPTAILMVYLVAYSAVVLRTVRPSYSDQLLVQILPVLAALSGAGMALVISRMPAKIQPVGATVLTLLMVAGPLVYSMDALRTFTSPDTRQIAQAWVYDHLPRGAWIHRNGPYNLPLDEADYRWTQNFAGDLISPEALRESGADYMAVSDAWYHDVMRSWEFVDAAERERIQRYLDELDSAFTRIAFFPRPASPGSDVIMHTLTYWHNPSITLYCLNAAACAAVQP